MIQAKIPYMVRPVMRGLISVLTGKESCNHISGLYVKTVGLRALMEIRARPASSLNRPRHVVGPWIRQVWGCAGLAFRAITEESISAISRC